MNALRHLGGGQEHVQPIFVTLKVNGQSVRGLVDSGATASYLSQEFCQQIQATSTPFASPTVLANGVEVPSQVTPELPIETSTRSGVLSFIVLEQLRYSCILGLDAMTKLGLAITGIPSETERPRDSDHDQFEVLPEEYDPQDRHPEYESIMRGVQDLLEENGRLDPYGFCTLEYAEVPLPTSCTPIFRKQYPVPYAQQQALTDGVEEWLRDGVIAPADPASRWNSPILAVPKKDLEGNYTLSRPCIDPRPINQAMDYDLVNNVPNIQQLTQAMHGFEVITELDLARGFHQIRIREEDQEKLTFTWNRQRYMFIGAPFGLKHVPEIFQFIMFRLFAGLTHFVAVYIDNIYVFSASATDHIAHLREVISRLNVAQLRLKIPKCHFGYTRACVLGHLVGGTLAGNNQSLAPRKRESLNSLPTPTTGKEVSAWLGLANYLRAYIPLYSTIAAPLEPLRKLKSVVSQWGPAQDAAMALMKQVLSKAPVLSQPDFQHSFMVATDASLVGLGAVLYQVIDDITCYIAFESRSLAQHQKAYPTTLRELLAILFALSKFHNYLYGKRFTLFTDHRALTFLFDHRNRSLYLAHWAATLFQYDFEIIHRPGIRMVLPDALSRIYPDNLWSSHTPAAPELNALASEAPAPRASMSLDTLVRQRFDKSSTPPNGASQEAFVSAVHARRHLSANDLFVTIWKRGYFWPQLYKQCANVVGSCQACLAFNVRRSGFHPMTPVTASLPFAHLALDTGDFNLVSADGSACFLVIVDICTKFCWLRAMPDATALTTARTLYKLCTDFGVPAIIQADNGAEFENAVVVAFNNLLGISYRPVTPYHPQGNGASEIYVGLAKKCVQKTAKGDMSNWAALLPTVQFELNQRVTRRHNSTPFSLMFGRPAISDANGPPLSPEQLIERFKQLHDLVYPAIVGRTSDYNKVVKRHFDAKHKLTSFPIGAMVMLRKSVDGPKTDPPYSGPFKVAKRSKGGSYLLTDPAGDLHPSPVAPDRLSLIRTPVEVDPSTTYDIEKIVDHRDRKKTREYLVKWKDFPASQNTWEPVDNFFDQTSISNYWKDYIPKRRKKRTTNSRDSNPGSSQ